MNETVLVAVILAIVGQGCWLLLLTIEINLLRNEIRLFGQKITEKGS